MSASLWLRWSWRDLRARWVQVAAIAFVIAVGTGTYAGMSSVTVWRTLSNEASYELTNIYDLRARLSPGSFVTAGALLEKIGETRQAGTVETAEERLIVPTQIDATTDGETILVPGRVIGMDLSDGGPHVNGLHVSAGRELGSEDVDQDVAILERNFADHYELAAEGDLRLAGDRTMHYVGLGLAPEYLVVMTDEGGFFAQANFAAVFTSLETAQRVAGKLGMVNDLVLALTEGADHDAVAAELEEALGALGATVMRVEDDLSYRFVTKDPEGDQQFYDVFAVALFAGAVFAAFNLTTRMVEAQRREIGISMAVGLPALRIALRPLLVGAQIALLGVVFGVGMGLLVGQAMRSFLTDFIPLPIWETPFQPRLFVEVAVVGLLMPFLATAYPVWRAVRVAPVDAIKAGHLAARGGGLAPLIRRVPLPGNSLGEMPFRNLLRAPRRVVLTLLAIAAVLTLLIAVVGMVDSFLATMGRGEEEVLGNSPDRLAIDLDSIRAILSSEVGAVLESSVLSRSEPGLRLAGTLMNGNEEVDAFLLFIDFESEMWTPSVTSGSLDSYKPGIVIAEGAAKDLEVSVGDTLTLRHPVRQGPFSFILTETPLPVLGVHPHPFRFYVYMDMAHAGTMGLGGTTNVVYGEPADGDAGKAKAELFGMAGVASVQGVATSAQIVRDLMEEFVGVFQVVQGAVLVLALVIAFNTASINMDERAREHATMFAYGVPLRTVLRMAVVESLVIGLLATAVGLIGGYLMLKWMIEVLWPRVSPELAAVMVLSPGTLIVALGLGVLAVGAAPLLTVRKLRRMDVPSTLRVME